MSRCFRRLGLGSPLVAAPRPALVSGRFAASVVVLGSRSAVLVAVRLLAVPASPLLLVGWGGAVIHERGFGPAASRIGELECLSTEKASPARLAFAPKWGPVGISSNPGHRGESSPPEPRNATRWSNGEFDPNELGITRWPIFSGDGEPGVDDPRSLW